MKLITIAFEINALEDFHIGTGLDCTGLYDDGQLKDDQGNPSIRPETMKGLLRQSCREIKRAFPGTYDGAYNAVFHFREMGSLDVSVSYQGCDTSPFIIHTFTAIDSKTGTGLDSTLRDIEFGAKGCRFDCRVYLELRQEKLFEKTKQLLQLGIRNIKWIGGLRRRGFGAVRCRIFQRDFGSASNNFDEEQIGCCVRLLLEFQDDVCLSGAGQTGNHIHTLDYITGTTALGMLRNILLKTTDKEDLSFMDDGNVSITNFYPTPKKKLDDSVVIPAPASLRKRKSLDQYRQYYLDRRSEPESDQEVPHWMIRPVLKQGDNPQHFFHYVNQDTLIEDNVKDPDGFSDKSISGEYIVFDNNSLDPSSAGFFKPKKILVMRNTITPETQTAEENALYTQDMIGSGTCFAGMIRFSDTEKAERFKTVYKDWLTGKLNFHAGRGGKPLAVKDVKLLEAPETLEEKKTFFTDLQDTAGNFLFSVTLLSDLILYDENLMPETILHPRYLKLDKELKLEKYLVSNRIHQSFSGLSGLHRFSDRVITKGSCFLYSLTENGEYDLVKNALLELEANCIGLKKEEGFGRVAVNLPVHAGNPGQISNENYAYKVIQSQIPGFLKSELEKIDADLAEAEKSVKVHLSYSKESGNTFINRIISYMEAGVPGETIEQELTHHTQRRTKAADNWKTFKQAWDKLNGSRSDNQPEKFQEQIYRLIKLAHLLKKAEDKAGVD